MDAWIRGRGVAAYLVRSLARGVYVRPAGWRRGSSGLFFDVLFDVFDVQLPVSQRLRASLDALEIGILTRRDRPGGSGLGFKATRFFHLMPVLSRAFTLSFELCRSSTVCQWSPPLQDVHACRPGVRSPLDYQISQHDSRRGPPPLKQEFLITAVGR